MDKARQHLPRHERVPDELLQERKPGEGWAAYKQRLKDGAATIKKYLKGFYETKKEPSTRTLRKVLRGKRNPYGLRQRERLHIERILGIPFTDLVHMANGNYHIADDDSVERVNTLLNISVHSK